MRGTILRRAAAAVAAVAAVAIPLALGVAVPAGATGAALDVEGPVGECDWVDPGAIADLTVHEAVDRLDRLTTFSAAVQASGLADDLHAQGPFTVFAPSNAAIEEIPANVFDAMLADGDLLRSIVGFHIVAGQQLSPADLAAAGTVETLSGPIEITADGGPLTVEGAQVTCAGIVTADATVYAIDTVLQPPVEAFAPCGSVPSSSAPATTLPPSTAVPPC